MTTAPLAAAGASRRVWLSGPESKTTPARPSGTWTSWAVALPGADWEEHDEQAIWQEMDD